MRLIALLFCLFPVFLFAQLRLGPSVQYNPFAWVASDDRYETANTHSVAGQLLLGWEDEKFTLVGIGLGYRRIDYEVLDRETEELIQIRDRRISIIGAGFINAGSEWLPGLYLPFRGGLALPLRRQMNRDDTRRFNQAPLVLEFAFGAGYRWILGEQTEIFVEALVGGDVRHLWLDRNNPPPWADERFTGWLFYVGLQTGIRL